MLIISNTYDIFKLLPCLKLFKHKMSLGVSLTWNTLDFTVWTKTDQHNAMFSKSLVLLCLNTAPNTALVQQPVRQKKG